MAHRLLLPLLPALALAVPLNGTSSPSILSSAVSSFGGRIFHELVAGEDEGANVVMSPLSLHLALGLVLQGAGGATRAELATLLGLQGAGVEEVLGATATTLARYQGGPALRLATALYSDPGRVSVRPGWRGVAEATYRAAVGQVDYSRPDLAAHTINTWVAEHTEGLIDQVSCQLNHSLLLSPS